VTAVGDPVSAAFMYGLGAAVAVAWVASTFADILILDYSTPLPLHGLMGTVVGSVFGAAGLQKARQKARDKLLEDDSKERGP
jgi:hypothetical protein